jgi:group II intron reverse transcriptase/maturase
MRKWNEKYHDKFKRHSMSSRLWDMRNLNEAWRKVKANKGSGGIDGESVEGFGAQFEQNLRELQRLLRTDRYQPDPVRRVYIPKANGGKRPLGIPTVRDRVVQQAVKNLLEPIFEESFLPCSHGYRPGKNAHQVIRKAEAYIERGYTWVVDADIKGFFDHVDHQIMMDLVREKVADGRVLDMVEAFLKSGVMNEGTYEETEEGTPQGGVISPLLANIYLNHFDRRMGEEGFLLLRYADDFLIFCKSEWEADKALKTAHRILEQELRLTLHPDKTRIVLAWKEGVEFLGFRFNGRWRRPRNKAVKKFRDAIRNETRRQQPNNIQTVIQNVNPIIIGWGRYFAGGTVKRLFRLLDAWVRARLRCFKAKRRTEEIICGTLPSEVLRQMGLVSLTSLIPQDPLPAKGKYQTRAVCSKRARTVR